MDAAELFAEPSHLKEKKKKKNKPVVPAESMDVVLETGSGM
jgi:hypothetical protein